VTRFHASPSNETHRRRDETIFATPRKSAERMRVQYAIGDQQRSSIMWAYMISIIYHLACRASLAQMGRHHLGR
jgi:hypothetical protein